MSRDWRLYLEDIERACEKVGRFTHGSDLETFIADERPTTRCCETSK